MIQQKHCAVCQWLRSLADWIEGFSKETQPPLVQTSEMMQEVTSSIARYKEATASVRTELEEIAQHPFPLELLLSRIAGKEGKPGVHGSADST